MVYFYIETQSINLSASTGRYIGCYLAMMYLENTYSNVRLEKSVYKKLVINNSESGDITDRPLMQCNVLEKHVIITTCSTKQQNISITIEVLFIVEHY